ncbi:MAG: hypothetical protein JXB46_06965, partial [Candidatus Eisenbacteria bacterium]|nr:hypothetical protein [Candidatus Eisenbacteria bacterium]
SGIYRHFAWELGSTLRPDDLPIALTWITEKYKKLGPLADIFRELLKDVFALALQHLDRPNLASALAKAIISRWAEYDDDDFLVARDDEGDRKWEMSDEQRRALVRALATHMPAPDQRDHIPAAFRTTVFQGADLAWMIEEIRRELDSHRRRVWAHFIWRVFDWKNVDHTEALLIAAAEVPELRNRFQTVIDPVRLDSDEAKEMREHLAWERRHAARVAEESEVSAQDTHEPLVSELLDYFEAGQTPCMWQAICALALERPRSGGSLIVSQTDIRKWPGWSCISSRSRERILTSAVGYFAQVDPEPDRWFGANTTFYPAWAGYCILELLLHQDRAKLDELAEEIWRRWAWAVVGIPCHARDEDAQCLVHMAYRHAPDEVLAAVQRLLLATDEQHARRGLIQIMSLCVDQRAVGFLLELVRLPRLAAQAQTDVCAFLMEHGVVEARRQLESHLSRPLPAEGPARTLAISAARVLMGEGGEEGWNAAWPVILAEPEIGDAVFIEMMAMAETREVSQSFHERLPENLVAELHMHLYERFSPATDPKPTGMARALGPEDMVRDLRDSLLRALEQRGTSEAIAALERIAEARPSEAWRRSVVVEAEQNMLRRSWCPLTPEDLHRLLENAQRRWVECPNHLMAVLLESLERYQQRLHGHTPRVGELWNTSPTIRPKSEPDVSDHVKAFLEDDLRFQGVIANREVEVWRPASTGLGKRTDIHVDAVTLPERRAVPKRVTVVIEVKGCWNPDLDTAMETQLHDKYLREGSCTHGIYLVGWFACDRWDTADNRRCPMMSIEDARAHFSEQAQALSVNGFVIRSIVLNLGLPS